MLLEPQDTLSFLSSLIENKVRESARLEFKQTLRVQSREEKREFCKDVAAMANHQGGVIVYGVAEEDGAAAMLTPFDIEDVDAFERTLVLVLQTVEPRLKVRFEFVPMNGQFCVLVHVFETLFKPYCLSYDDKRVFPQRSGTLTSYMTYHTLKETFTRYEFVEEKARAFREKRVQHILGQFPYHPDKPLLILHILPLAPFLEYQKFSPEALRDASPKDLVKAIVQTEVSRPNIDGVLYVHATREDDLWQQMQLFRDGGAEYVSYIHAIGAMKDKTIPSRVLSKKIEHFLRFSVFHGQKLDIRGSALVFCDLLNISQYRFVRSLEGEEDLRVADRDHIEFPELLIEDFSDKSSEVSTRALLLDMLWQAFGFERFGG